MGTIMANTARRAAQARSQSNRKPVKKTAKKQQQPKEEVIEVNLDTMLGGMGIKLLAGAAIIASNALSFWKGIEVGRSDAAVTHLQVGDVKVPLVDAMVIVEAKLAADAKEKKRRETRLLLLEMREMEREMDSKDTVPLRTTKTIDTKAPKGWDQVSPE
jgi:hypothetical protein